MSLKNVSELFRPAYLSLTRTQLEEKTRRAIAGLADCRACPRDCGVNRLEDKWSACKTGRYAGVSSYFPHFGEEDCLRGWRGSGTIFFSHCNLRCVFCQNYDISQAIRPGKATPGLCIGSCHEGVKSSALPVLRSVGHSTFAGASVARLVRSALSSLRDKNLCIIRAR